MQLQNKTVMECAKKLNKHVMHKKKNYCVAIDEQS